MVNDLVLSIFPGIDLLGQAFEETGFCVVRGPDLLWGGDIRRFHPPTDVFWGIIGGPPCQEFSGLLRTEPTGYGQEMLNEYARVVLEARPEWWLMENVARVPDCDIAGYVTQRFDINQGWYCDVSRLRHIQFGSRSGRLLNVTRRRVTTDCKPTALANDKRSFEEVAHLQGLPKSFDLPPFKVSEKIRAIGNGVPMVMGRELAKAVSEAYNRKTVTVQADFFDNIHRNDVCACGCGRLVTPGSKYAKDISGRTDACRKRAERRRRKWMSHRRGVK